MIRRLPSLLLLGACLAILQVHGWRFWTAYAGDLGPLWAMALEGASLWAWWSRRWLLGSLAVVLTLAGPLGAVGVPVWQSIQATERAEAARVAVVAQHRAAIEGLEEQRRTYLANSTDRRRSGWASAIEATQTRLATERADLAKAEREGQAGLPALLGHGVVVLQALALVLFQGTAVLCIRYLRDSFTTSGPGSVVVEGGMGPTTIPYMAPIDEPGPGSSAVPALPAPAASKREMIRAAILAAPSQSNRRIALAVGATHPTVAAVRAELSIGEK
jgi:hypothetical protein